jgi:precorrin-3B synthase
MLSGDGFLSRVKPYAASISVAQARIIAEQAILHGNGAIDLTQRGNLQPRGFSVAGAASFADVMHRAGLAHADPAVERGRNLLAPPLLGWDATIAPGTDALVTSLTAAMATWPVLPAKFGILVDGGGVLGLGSGDADILLRNLGSAVELRLGGGDLVVLCAPSQVVAHATALARAFAGFAPAGRMRQAVAAHGASAILAAAGLHGDADRSSRGPTPQAVGLLPGRALGVAPPFGQMHAAQLAALADLAERQGDGSLRVTPWRALLLPGVMDAMAAARPGFIVRADDPRLRIAACTGAPGCGSATFDTRAVAARLAGQPGLLHVSGCAKGCAHPGVAPLVLVGQADGYGIVRAGSAGDQPWLSGLTLEEAMLALEDL